MWKLWLFRPATLPPCAFWSRTELFKSSSERLKDKKERQLFIDGSDGGSLPLTSIYYETAAGSFFWILVVRNGWKRQLSIFMCSDSFKRARPRALIEGSTPIRFEYKNWQKKRIKSCTGRTDGVVGKFIDIDLTFRFHPFNVVGGPFGFGGSDAAMLGVSYVKRCY